VTSDRSMAHTGRGGTVGGGGNCATDTEVSMQDDVGWNETRVAPGKAAECHTMTIPLQIIGYVHTQVFFFLCFGECICFPIVGHLIPGLYVVPNMHHLTLFTVEF